MAIYFVALIISDINPVKYIWIKLSKKSPTEAPTYFESCTKIRQTIQKKHQNWLKKKKKF